MMRQAQNHQEPLSHHQATTPLSRTRPIGKMLKMALLKASIWGTRSLATALSLPTMAINTRDTLKRTKRRALDVATSPPKISMRAYGNRTLCTASAATTIAMGLYMRESSAMVRWMDLESIIGRMAQNTLETTKETSAMAAASTMTRLATATRGNGRTTSAAEKESTHLWMEAVMMDIGGTTIGTALECIRMHLRMSHEDFGKTLTFSLTVYGLL